MNLDDVEKVVAEGKRCGGHEDGLDFFLFSVILLRILIMLRIKI